MTFVISDALHGHLVRQGTIRDGWTMISATSKTDRSGANSRRWLALWVLCAGFLLVAVDMTIVNVALPSIGHDLGFSQSGLAWVVDAYLIAYGGCLLLAGRLGDLWGRNRIFVAGLTTFSAASLLCAVSNSQSMLIGLGCFKGSAAQAVPRSSWEWSRRCFQRFANEVVPSASSRSSRRLAAGSE